MSYEGLSETEFATQVSLGLITGVAEWHMLGERPSATNDAAGEDVWAGDAVRMPIPPDAGDFLSFVSDDAQDNPAGTGVGRIRIVYLDPAGDEQSAEYDTDGLTEVVTTIQARFVQRTHTVATVGSNTVAVGNIDVYKAGDDTTVYDRIYAGGNRSLSCAWMVPRGKTLLVTRWNSSQGKNQAVPMRLRTTSDGLQIHPRIFLFLDNDTLHLTAAAARYNPPLPVPAFAIIKVSGWPGSVGAQMAASCSGYLYDNAIHNIVYP